MRRPARASSRERLLDRASGRALVTARSLFGLLNRAGPLRRAGASLCWLMAESTVARLRRHPDIADVLMRGSYGRGDPTPFVSDLDLVIITREIEGRPSLRATQAVQRALDAAARTNPLLRDRWHLFLGESDLGLVGRYRALFSVDEWSSPGPIVTSAGTVPDHLSDIASWNRQHMWTDTAFRCAFSPAPPTTRSLLGFTAAEKKAIYHWARIRRASPVERRALPADSRELGLRCADLVGRLGETATALAPPPGSPFPASAEPDEIVAFAAMLRSQELESELRAAYRFDGGLALLHEEGADLGTLCSRLPAVARAAGRRVVLYSPAAAACAPLLGGVAELWRKPGSAGLPAEPAFLEEQFLYEALSGGADLRLRASSESTPQARRYCTIRLVRWLTFLRTGRLLRGDDEAFAAAPPADPADTAAWFAAASGLWLQLRGLLETL